MAAQVQVSQRQRQTSEKTKKDIDDLIRLYLSEHFDPFGKDEGREEADASVDTEFEFKYYTEKLGKVLAQSGDDYDKEKLGGSVSAAQIEENQNLLRSLFANYNENNKEESWKRFKEIMDNSKANGLTGHPDPIKVLRTCLLTIHGLKSLGEGIKGLAKSYTQRFISEAQVDQDIARIGGLKGFLESQLD